MATAKKAAPAKTTKKASKPAAEDDLLATKKAPAKKAKAAAVEDDMLATKAKKAPAKKKAAAASFDGTAEEVRAVLLKTRKSTSYEDIAAANNFNIRMVRRQARALRDTGELEITKVATKGHVNVPKAKK